MTTSILIPQRLFLQYPSSVLIGFCFNIEWFKQFSLAHYFDISVGINYLVSRDYPLKFLIIYSEIVSVAFFYNPPKLFVALAISISIHISIYHTLSSSQDSMAQPSIYIHVRVWISGQTNNLLTPTWSILLNSHTYLFPDDPQRKK